MLAYFVDISRADGEDKIARLRCFAQILLYLIKGFEKLCPLYLLGKVCRGDTENILFTGGKYLRQINDIRTAELTHEVVKQCHRARIGMRLEYNDGTLVAQRLHSVEQSLQLARVVGVIVINVRAVEKPARPYFIAVGFMPRHMQAAAAASAFLRLCTPGT